MGTQRLDSEHQLPSDRYQHTVSLTRTRLSARTMTRRIHRRREATLELEGSQELVVFGEKPAGL